MRVHLLQEIIEGLDPPISTCVSWVNFSQPVTALALVQYYSHFVGLYRILFVVQLETSSLSLFSSPPLSTSVSTTRNGGSVFLVLLLLLFT